MKRLLLAALLALPLALPMKAMFADDVLGWDSRWGFRAEEWDDPENWYEAGSHEHEGIGDYYDEVPDPLDNDVIVEYADELDREDTPTQGGGGATIKYDDDVKPHVEPQDAFDYNASDYDYDAHGNAYYGEYDVYEQEIEYVEDVRFKYYTNDWYEDKSAFDSWYDVNLDDYDSLDDD